MRGEERRLIGKKGVNENILSKFYTYKRGNFLVLSLFDNDGLACVIIIILVFEITHAM